MPIGDGGTYGTGWVASQAFFNTLTTDYWLPRINDAKNNKTVVLEVIPSSSDRIAGKFVREPVKFGRNVEAIAAVRERGKLPDPGSPAAVEYAYRPRKIFFRAVVDGDIMRATMMDAVRYVDVISDIMEQGSDDLAYEAARMMHNDGSGRLAEVNAGVASATQTLRHHAGLESSTTDSSPLSLFIQPGNRLAFWSPDGATHRGTRIVASLGAEVLGPPATLVVVLDATITTTTGDWVTRVAPSTTSGVPSRDSGNRAEPMGLGGIFGDQGVLDGHGIATIPAGAYSYVPVDNYTATNPATAGFQGIDADGTRPFNQALILANGGVLRAPSEELLQTGFSLAEETNNGMVDMVLSGYGERDRYGETLTPDKRFTNTTQLSGGWTGLDIKGKPWVVDRLCPRNRIYLLALESAGFMQHVQTSFQALDPLGAHWYRSGADDDQYQGAWVMAYNVGVGVRNRTGCLITDVLRS